MDDYPLAVIPTVPMWSENYAYMVNDRDSGLAIVALLGRWTQDPTVWREFLVIGLPGDRIVYHKAFGRGGTRTEAAGSLMRISFPKQGVEHRVVFDGPMAEDKRQPLLARGVSSRPLKRSSLEFTMTGVAPVWDISGHANDATDIAGRMHVEQVGVVEGTFTYGQEKFPIREAFGQRDHSRGIRIITNFYRHCWCQGHFPSAHVTFNIYVMETHGGNARMAHGTVSKGDRRYPAMVSDLRLMEGPYDGNRLYDFKLTSELGTMHIRMTRVLISLPKSFTSPWDVNVGAIPGYPVAYAFEEAVVWRWDDHEGSGWSERAFNPEPYPE
jgi:hypothetical protein